MKALTLTQPWVSLVAAGLKRFETRSWRTDYRGPLAIHAAKSIPREARHFMITNRFVRQMALSEHGAVPQGLVVAVCRLVDVRPTNGNPPSDREAALGDWRHGRYAWELADIERLLSPIPATGALGLWNWEAENGALEQLSLLASNDRDVHGHATS